MKTEVLKRILFNFDKKHFLHEISKILKHNVDFRTSSKFLSSLHIIEFKKEFSSFALNHIPTFVYNLISDIKGILFLSGDTIAKINEIKLLSQTKDEWYDLVIEFEFSDKTGAISTKYLRYSLLIDYPRKSFSINFSGTHSMGFMFDYFDFTRSYIVYAIALEYTESILRIRESVQTMVYQKGTKYKSGERIYQTPGEFIQEIAKTGKFKDVLILRESDENENQNQ